MSANDFMEPTADDVGFANPQTARRLTYGFSKLHGVIAAREDLDENILEVLVREGGACTSFVLSEIRRSFKKPLRTKQVSAKSFDKLLEQTFTGGDDETYQFMDNIEIDQSLQHMMSELPQNAELLESVDDAPIIRLINTVLTQALREKASDVHFELFENRSIIRFRIDGALKDILEPAKALHSAIVSRIKVMANMDIAEKRLPQDGRFTLKIAGRPVDVRISTLPTGHGERVVLRLLDKQQGTLQLNKLGMSLGMEQELDALIHKPHGIILVTGPTGSGKTTTLYAALTQLDSKSLNIMTVEEPIEYDLDGINQTQVDPKIDMTFARALRSILRQDPDVVMIGEIRDLETARIAVQASLTGHLVLATLHTNDSAGAITRLVDMGVEPYLLASSMLGVMAQRLLRRLCPECRVKYKPDATELSLMPDGEGELYGPGGCKKCDNLGYHGRTGIFELLVVDDDIRHLIHDKAPEYKIRNHAVDRLSMVRLKDDAMRLASKGDSSLSEALRITEG